MTRTLLGIMTVGYLRQHSHHGHPRTASRSAGSARRDGAPKIRRMAGWNRLPARAQTGYSANRL